MGIDDRTGGEAIVAGVRCPFAGRVSMDLTVLDVTEEPLVSSDFHGDTHSAVVDLASTRRGPNGQAKVLAWYDNEAGYAARVVDLCRFMGASAPAAAAAPSNGSELERVS